MLAPGPAGVELVGAKRVGLQVDFDVLVNGNVVGSFSILDTDLGIQSLSFSFPAIAGGGTYTVELLQTNTVAGGISLGMGTDNVFLSSTSGQDQIVIPVVGQEMYFLRVFSSPVAVVDPINAGFESGDFTGWTTSGTVSIEDATFGSGPTEGTFDALLSTAGDTVGGTAASAAAIEAQLGMALGTLNLISPFGPVTSGAAISQVITLNAGDLLTFDWNFLTDEGFNGSTRFFDFAFWSLTPVANPGSVLAAPFRYLYAGSVLLVLLGLLFVGWAVVNLFTPAPSIYVLLIGLLLWLFSALFFGVAVLAQQGRMLQRDLWRVQSALLADRARSSDQPET